MDPSAAFWWKSGHWPHLMDNVLTVGVTNQHVTITSVLRLNAGKTWKQRKAATAG